MTCVFVFVACGTRLSDVFNVSTFHSTFQSSIPINRGA